MPDVRTPRKRRGPRPGKRKADGIGDLADLDDAELAATLLGTEWVKEPAQRPLWMRVIKWVGLIGCVIVFPVGLCVLCSWLLWRFPGPILRHRLQGKRVVGKVVGNQEVGFSDDRCYRATVEYTFKARPFTTQDGPQMTYWPWRIGDPVLIYHIPGSGEPGRHVRPGALAIYAILFLLLNLVVFGLGLSGGMALWVALTGRGAP